MGVPMSVSLVNRLGAIDPPSPKPKTPASPKKLAANRKNSQKSTGPRTKEGKATVSQNARKHGCSQSVLLPSECDATYQIHLAELREDLRPTTPTQYALVSQISQILWKLHRMADTEKELFAMNANENEFPCQTLARAFHTDPTRNDFNLFERYQRQLRTQWLRLHTHYRQLKKDPPRPYDDDGGGTREDARRRIEQEFLHPTDPPDTHVNLTVQIPPTHFPHSNAALQTTNHTPQTPPPIKPTNTSKNPIPESESPPTHQNFNQTNPPPPPPAHSPIENRKSKIPLPILPLLLCALCALCAGAIHSQFTPALAPHNKPAIFVRPFSYQGAGANMPLIAPHGGKLVNRILEASAAKDAAKQAETLQSITLSTREAFDLEMIAIGAFSPITGFMGQKDFTGVCKDMRLANGTVWPIPSPSARPTMWPRSSTSGRRSPSRMTKAACLA
jgi:hypothetical protein